MCCDAETTRPQPKRWIQFCRWCSMRFIGFITHSFEIKHSYDAYVHIECNFEWICCCCCLSLSIPFPLLFLSFVDAVFLRFIWHYVNQIIGSCYHWQRWPFFRYKMVSTIFIFIIIYTHEANAQRIITARKKHLINKIFCRSECISCWYWLIHYSRA